MEKFGGFLLRKAYYAIVQESHSTRTLAYYSGKSRYCETILLARRHNLPSRKHKPISIQVNWHNYLDCLPFCVSCRVLMSLRDLISSVSGAGRMHSSWRYRHKWKKGPGRAESARNPKGPCDQNITPANPSSSSCMAMAIAYERHMLHSVPAASTGHAL
jgi:hypothetical protein